MYSETPPQTPLADLLKRFQAAPFLIARERADELKNIRDSLNIRINLLCDTRDFTCHVDTDTGLISVSLTALERVWCYCYAFHAAHTWRAKHPKETEFDASVHAELKPIFELLEEVRQSELGRRKIIWQNHLPRPDQNTTDNAVLNAGGSFLYVASFLVLHEVGHVVLKHPNRNVGLSPSECIRQELEADAWAADFILKNWKQSSDSPDEFINRASGIATGIALLASIELGIHPDAPRDHPKIPERLLRFFEDHIPDTEGKTADLTEFPKYYASIIIYTLMQQRKIAFDYTIEHPNFFDLLMAVRNLF